MHNSIILRGKTMISYIDNFKSKISGFDIARGFNLRLVRTLKQIEYHSFLG